MHSLKCMLLTSVFLFSAHQPLTTLARASKILQGKINMVPAILNYALNFSPIDSKVDSKEFQIIFEYLQNNQGEHLGPFVFQNTLTSKSNISKLVNTLHVKLTDNYHLAYEFSNGDPFSTEISVYKEDSLFERLKHFFETIPTGCAVAFVYDCDYFNYRFFAFIKFLARLLRREEPINALSKSSKVDSWLSFDGQKSQDLLTNDFGTKKTRFFIELSNGRTPRLAENATSKYTFIQFSYWDSVLFGNILESMKDQQYQRILSKIMNQVGKDPLCLQTLTGM